MKEIYSPCFSTLPKETTLPSSSDDSTTDFETILLAREEDGTGFRDTTLPSSSDDSTTDFETILLAREEDGTGFRDVFESWADFFSNFDTGFAFFFGAGGGVVS
jgi:hypothetical protein